MQTKKCLSILLLGYLTTDTQTIFAADLPTLPSSVSPALIGNQVPMPTNKNLKTPPVTTTNNQTPSQALPPEAQKIKFKLNQIHLIGATVYKADQLETSYQNYLGKNISLMDLQTITDNITKRYREDGYLLSKAIIPAQKINNGVVTIQVIEGYISTVSVTGKPKNAKALLQAYTDHLTQEAPITVNTLERYVLLANDVPGVDSQIILSPAKNTATTTATPGATEATLIANEHTANGYFGVDNRGTAYLGPIEYSFGGSVNSIFRSGDQTTIQGLVTEHLHQLQFYRLSHQTPLGSSGLQLNLSASRSKSHPGNVASPGQPLATIGIVGASTSYSIGLSYPVIRSRAQSLFVNATFDTSNSTSDIGSYFNMYNDKIRSLRLGATYNNADNWRGVNQIGTQISQGLPILSNSSVNQTDKEGNPTLSRSKGHSVYTKFNLDISRQQWIGNTNFSVLVAATGQYAFNPLLVAEQFSFGGSQYGKAYDPSEFTGDHGVAGKLELRYDQALSSRVFNHLQYFGFYDVGKVWNVNSETLAAQQTSGASFGAGIRTQFNKYISGYAEWAQPLTAPASAYQTKQPRVFFGITLSGDTSTSLNSGPTSTTATTQAYQPLSAQTPAVAAAASKGQSTTY